MTLDAGGKLTAAAALNLDGTTTLGAFCTFSDTTGLVTNDGDLDIGTGTRFTASAGLTNNLTVQVAGTVIADDELENNDDVEVQAGGSLTANGELNNTSNGTVTLDPAVGSTPVGKLTVSSTGALVNSGTVTDSGRRRWTGR